MNNQKTKTVKKSIGQKFEYTWNISVFYKICIQLKSQSCQRENKDKMKIILRNKDKFNFSF